MTAPPLADAFFLEAGALRAGAGAGLFDRDEGGDLFARRPDFFSSVTHLPAGELPQLSSWPRRAGVEAFRGVRRRASGSSERACARARAAVSVGPAMTARCAAGALSPWVTGR